MNFLTKIFTNAERYVGLCQVKRANKPYKTHFSNFAFANSSFYSTNVKNNIYLSL